jgi:hypothetical protein
MAAGEAVLAPPKVVEQVEQEGVQGATTRTCTSKDPRRPPPPPRRASRGRGSNSVPNLLQEESPCNPSHRADVAVWAMP